MKVTSKMKNPADSNSGFWILSREDGEVAELVRWPRYWTLNNDHQNTFKTKRAAVEHFAQGQKFGNL